MKKCIILFLKNTLTMIKIFWTENDLHNYNSHLAGCMVLVNSSWLIIPQNHSLPSLMTPPMYNNCFETYNFWMKLKLSYLNTMYDMKREILVTVTIWACIYHSQVVYRKKLLPCMEVFNSVNYVRNTEFHYRDAFSVLNFPYLVTVSAIRGSNFHVP